MAASLGFRYALRAPRRYWDPADSNPPANCAAGGCRHLFSVWLGELPSISLVYYGSVYIRCYAHLAYTRSAVASTGPNQCPSLAKAVKATASCWKATPQYRSGVWLVVQIGFFDQFCRLRLRRVHASAPKIVNKSADQVRNSEEVKGLMGLGRYRENISAHAIRRPIIHWIAGNPPGILARVFHLGALPGAMVSSVRLRPGRLQSTLQVVAQFRPPELFGYGYRVFAIGVDAVSALANRRSFGAAERVPVLQARVKSRNSTLVSNNAAPPRARSPSDRRATSGPPAWAVTSSCTWAKRRSPFDPGRLGWSRVLSAHRRLTATGWVVE